MNTRDKLELGLDAIKNGNAAEAQQFIKEAFEIDLDNNFENLALAIFNRELLVDELASQRFKNTYSKYIEEVTKDEKQDTIIINNNNQIPLGKAKKKSTAIVLCIFGGLFGFHKFYEGKIGMGILYMFTGGLFLIGMVLDLIKLIAKDDIYYVY